MEETSENLSLEELNEIENLRERTYNICKNNNLKDLEKIINYYLEHRDFFDFKQCGRRTNGELIDICNKYKHLFSVTSNVSEKNQNVDNNLFSSYHNQISDSIKYLSIHQNEIINYRLNIYLKKSSNRLKSILGDSIDSFFVTNQFRKVTTL